MIQLPPSLPELVTLDPTDPALLFFQDELIAEGGDVGFSPAWHFHTEWISPSKLAVASPLRLKKCDLTDTELRVFLDGLRHALKLPLSDEFHGSLAWTLDMAESEAARRLRTRNRPQQTSQWEQADILAEVEAITGPLVKRGREWWTCCPFHTENTPSFHVNAEKRTWRCFGCGKGGGVVDWRKAWEK